MSDFVTERRLGRFSRTQFPWAYTPFGYARTCQWLDGDPAEQRYCGRKSVPGYSYCAHHKAIAYRPYEGRSVALGFFWRRFFSVLATPSIALARRRAERRFVSQGQMWN